MCAKCDKLNKQIVGIRLIVAGVTDELDLEAAETLIGRYEAEKRALHPEREE